VPVAAPYSLPVDPVGRARVLAALAVGLLVLVFATAALVVYCCQPSDNVVNGITDADDPAPVFTVGSSERPAVIPVPPAATAAENSPAPPPANDDAKPPPAQPAVPAQEPEPPPPAKAAPPSVQVVLNPEQKRINEAIDRGVIFLETSQFNNGRWDVGPYAVGYAALPGLTLLECGVPASDPVVQGAARFVRENAKTLSATYELSLAILFLDRLGDSRDRDLIQTLAIRLIAGQNTTGGWTYHCPLLGRPDQQHLLAFLRRTQTQPVMEPIPSSTPAGSLPLAKGLGQAARDPLAPAPALLANAIQKPADPAGTTALPTPGAAPQPGLFQPLDLGSPRRTIGPGIGEEKTSPVPRKPEPRPPTPEKKKPNAERSPKNDPLPAHLKNLTVVHMNDGSVKPRGVKANAKPKAMLRGVSGDNSNTQFAILALWVARRHGVPMERTLALIDHRFQTSQNADGGWGYHYEGAAAFTKPSMTCVGLLGLAIGHGFAQETAAGLKDAKDAGKFKKGERDQLIQRGLKKLGQYIGTPNRARLAGGILDLYTLWSIERVGVLYNLKTIGNKDWYGWAGQLLLAHQNPNGSWWARGYHGSSTTIDTCFALLILRRANLVQDLTENLRMLAITDPDGSSRATGGRGAP